MKLYSVHRRIVPAAVCTVRPIVNGGFRRPKHAKPKRAKRWGCRDGTCDAMTQRQAWRIFKQVFGRDLPREEVVQISRHKEAPWVEESRRTGIPLNEIMARSGD